jgi:hypothetical protein
MKYSLISLLASVSTLSSQAVAGDVYGPYPTTLKGYVGDKTNSVSYSGQVGRHLLHNSLKKAIGNGASLDEMNAYFNGSENELTLLDPKTSVSFRVDVTNINDVSKTNLSGKAFKGEIGGWPGNMSGKAVLENMIVKASQVEKGYDSAHGYDYAQLVSKFTMGAVFYHQACDNYLDEKLTADNKPNNKPYKDGAYYTGKEHSWDEGFGYWGAAAHGAKLSPRQNYDIAKKKDMASADANGDGVVNLKSEMNYAHAYYASAFDKGGQTNYYNTITKAFIDGREIIANANGAALIDSERFDLQAHARTICSNWERVIAEAVFKYAGSVYADIEKLRANSGDAKAYRTYVKHWGELKGFALSLHTGKFSLGSLGAELDALIGYGPVLMNGTQVSSLDATGAYQMAGASVDGYMVNMLKVQNLMAEEFGIVAKNNDKLAGISNLAEALGLANSTEND